MRTTAMHEDAYTTGGQGLGCQQVPRQVTFLAGIAGPVQVDLNVRGGEPWADGFGETGEFLGAFILPSASLRGLLIFLGVIGEYLGRIYDEVKQRPLYVVAEAPPRPPTPEA